MAGVEEPCSKSEDGLGIVAGVNASDVGGEGPCALWAGATTGVVEFCCAWFATAAATYDMCVELAYV